MGEAALSDLLERLDRAGGRGRDVSLGHVLGRSGARAHGAAILLLALPEALPIPVPSLSAVLGVPLVLVSAHLALHGEGGTLPRRLLRSKVPGRVLGALSRRIAGPVRRAERISRPRLAALVARERPLGLLCLALSCVLLLPIPFLNAAPAAALVLIAWGLVQRDGAFVAAGLGASAATAALLLVMVEAALGLLPGAG